MGLSTFALSSLQPNAGWGGSSRPLADQEARFCGDTPRTTSFHMKLKGAYQDRRVVRSGVHLGVLLRSDHASHLVVAGDSA